MGGYAIDDSELQFKNIMETLPGVIGSLLKNISGKGPERQKVYICGQDIIVTVYGFISKGLSDTNYMDDYEMAHAVRTYYYRMAKKDIGKIHEFLKKSYGLELERVFCDFDLAANEGIYVFRCIKLDSNGEKKTI